MSLPLELLCRAAIMALNVAVSTASNVVTVIFVAIHYKLPGWRSRRHTGICVARTRAVMGRSPPPYHDDCDARKYDDCRNQHGDRDLPPGRPATNILCHESMAQGRRRRRSNRRVERRVELSSTKLWEKIIIIPDLLPFRPWSGFFCFFLVQ